MSVTIDDELMKYLRDVQGALIQKLQRDMSFTAVVNIVLGGGRAGAGDISSDAWGAVNDFIEMKQVNLVREGLTDSYVNRLK